MYVAAIVELHETVAVPELVTLVGLVTPHERFAGTVSDRLTVPVKPFSAVIVIVEVAETPALTAPGELAAIEKSLTVNVAVAVWVRVPLVPVIVNMYVAATVELHDTVAVPDPVMLVGDIAPQVRFVGTVSVKLTTPLNPLRAVTVIVELTDVPAAAGAGDEAVIVKSTMVKVAVVEWLSVPLVPVMVRR